MKSRGGLSGSGMFLIELILAILIFAVASAICLQIFVTSHQIAGNSSQLNHAVIAVQNGAECFKASGGNLQETAGLLGAEYTDGDSSVFIYLDDEWNDTPKTALFYMVEIAMISNNEGLVTGEVAVSDAAGDTIFSVPVSVFTPGEVAR